MLERILALFRRHKREPVGRSVGRMRFRDSISAMNKVWENGPQDTSQRLMLLALADAANDEGFCWPGMTTLAKKVCAHVRTVIRSLKALEKSGWITINRKAYFSKGNTYQINLEKLGDIESRDNLSRDKPGKSQVTFQVKSGDICCNANMIATHTSERELQAKPAPITIKNPKGTVNSSRSKRESDDRHASFQKATGDYWDSKNQGIEMPWDASEGKALSRLLKANPKLDLEAFKNLLRNRYRSDGSHAERPRQWLDKITNYAGGPLDRFNHPKGATNGKPGTGTTADRKIDSVFASTEASLERIDAMDFSEDRGTRRLIG